MIGRREFVAGIGAAAAAWPLAARAQQSQRIRRVGVLLATGNDAIGQSVTAAFQHALQLLGWIVGSNLSIEIRFAGADPERYRAYAAELIALSPDVIVSQSNSATTVLSALTSTIPIVFASASDPFENQLVTNMARPGGNVTGFTQLVSPIAGKYVQLLKEAAPALTRIAVMYNTGSAIAPAYLRAATAAAIPADIQIIPLPVTTRGDIESVIDKFAGGNSGIVVLSGPVLSDDRGIIIELAARYRLPALYPYRSFVADGGLMSYGPNTIDQWTLAASYVDRILRGEKPGDLPVQSPTKFELTINLRTAKSLGLDVPSSLLTTADEVIE